MEASVKHLSLPQQQTFATIMKSDHRYSEAASVDESATYAGIFSLWQMFETAAQSEEPYVPARVEHCPKLRYLFEAFHKGGIALVFVISHADTVFCMFQHRKNICHVEFTATPLQDRVKRAMVQNGIFGSMCLAWVYKN
jgi:hypothetical protein